MANSNDLKTFVEVWKYTKKDNAAGTPVEEFKLYRKKYANMRVLNPGGNESNLGNLPSTNVIFTLRYDQEIDYDCQIKYNNSYYSFQHIEVVDRKAWMKIQTTVVNDKH